MGDMMDIPAYLELVSIGYRGVPLIRMEGEGGVKGECEYREGGGGGVTIKGASLGTYTGGL